MKIAFYDAKSYDKEFFDRANNRFQFEIHYFETHLNPQTAVLAKGMDVVCPFVNDAVDAEVIQTLHKEGVKLLALRSAGYNHVDLKAAAGKIGVVRVPKYSPHAVAEHTVGLILCLNRKLHRAYNRTRENNFSIQGFLGFDLYGKTAGIVGAGAIGSIVIQILKGFGMRVLCYDPITEAAQKAGAEPTSLKALYKESDIISLHCPLTQDNRHMIDEAAFKAMKNGVMLINTGRGALIDTSALIHALKSKKIGAAGLDVYEEESAYFYEDLSSTFIDDDLLARLLSFPNVLITSHQAFFTREALENIAQTTLQNIQDFSQNKPLINEVCYA